VPSEEDVAYWRLRLERLMEEADPVLERYRRPSEAPASAAVSWWQALSLWWRPAVAGAMGLAASIVLVVGLGSGRAPAGPPGAEPDPAALVLSALASGGEPAALWQRAGIEADPLLALLALEPASREGGGR
jgi:hypothetical protein